jgi:hypothetical protein
MMSIQGKKRYGCLLLALITVGLSGVRPHAQTAPLLPAVDLRRDTRLDSNVWPADFNGDGVTDLIASRAATASTPAALRVVLGRGDGTFGDAILTNVAGRVIEVGDFNGDRRIDAVVATEDQNVGSVSILPGNGNGTFAAARQVDAEFAAFASTGDFNGDSRRDLVLVGGPDIRIYPGNGNLTFGTPARIPFPNPVYPTFECVSSLLGVPPCGGIVAGDLDNDGDRDFVVAAGDLGFVDVYLNNGNLLFSTNSIDVDLMSTDVTARDLDGDGNLDLVVSMTMPENQMYMNGAVDVWKGNGDGTFEPAVRYRTGNGPFQVVVGDFTHDGQIDIATANRSFIFWPNCGPFLQSSDSVSILPGNHGVFGAPTTFALADQSVAPELEPHRFRNTVLSLNTSDLDRDRFPDLIASYGALLLTRPPRANRPPVANAGPDMEIVNSSFFELSGTAVDPDNHLLDFVWTGPEGTSSGLLHPSRVCFENGLHPGANTFTLSVDDDHGGRDEDTVVYTSTDTTSQPEVTVLRPTEGEVVPAGQPYTIRWTASDDRGLASFDVGAQIDVGPNGRTIQIAECQDLPATATECTWQNPPATEAAIVFVEAHDVDGNVGGASSGVFAIRAGSPSLPMGWTNHDIGAVGATGNASFASGVFTVRGSGADIWDNADEFHYAYRTMQGNTEFTARVDSVQNVNRWVKAGLMIRESTNANARHVSIFATPTTEKGVAFQRRTTTGGASVHTSGPAIAPPLWLRVTRVGDVFRAYYRKNITDAWTLVGQQSVPGFPANALYGFAVSSHVDGQLAQARFSNAFVASLPDWSATSINAIGGTLAFDHTRFTVGASGEDIWGTLDEFVFLHTPFTQPEQTITARVLAITNTHRWAKAGVMIRETVFANSPHVMVIVSPGRGIAMQWRSVTDGTSESTTPRAGAAPAWVRLTRSGTTYTGYTSSDGVTWVTLGTVSITMQPNFAGLAVTSHVRPTQANGVFDDVRVQ